MTKGVKKQIAVGPQTINFSFNLTAKKSSSYVIALRYWPGKKSTQKPCCFIETLNNALFVRCRKPLE